MSALSLISLLSPKPTVQSRKIFLTPSRGELCRCSCGGRLGIIRGEIDSRVPDSRNRVAAKAGMGRYSGAVHGTNTQRSRRRRTTSRPDGYDENSREYEDNSGKQAQRYNLDNTIEGSGLEGAIHDDGVSTTDLAVSHQRYLSELGVTHINDEEGMDYQLHPCNKVADGCTWVPIGTDGDLGHQQVNSVSISKNVNGDDREGTNATWEGGKFVPVSYGDLSGKVDSKKDKDRKGAQERKARKSKVHLNESTANSGEVDSVVQTVISNPELSSEQYLKEGDEHLNPVTSRVDLQPDSSIVRADDGHLDDKDISFFPTSEDSGKSRKQRRKTRKKSDLDTESPNDGQVRIIEDEAQQPSAGQMLPANQKRRRRKRGSGIPSAGANVELQITEKAVVGLEEREGSGMARDLCETLENGVGSEECLTVPEVSLEEPLNQSTAALSDYFSVPVEYSEEEQSRSFAFLDSEHSNEVGGERSEFVNAEAEEGVVGTDAEAETEDTVESAPIGIELEVSVARTLNSSSGILDSKSSMKSSNDEFLTTRSLSTVKGPPVLALAIGAENFLSAEAMKITNPVVEQAVQVVSKVAELPAQVASKVVEFPTQVVSKVAELPGAVVEQATQVGTLVVEQVVEILPDAVTEQVGQVVSQVVDLQTEISDRMSLVADQVLQVGQMMVDQVAEAGESVVDQVSAAAEQVVQAAESVTSTANQVVDQVSEKVADMLSYQEDDESDSDDEFESYKTSDDPAFRGSRGLANFIILQEDQGVLEKIYDFYTYMLKQPLPKFSAAMFTAPLIVSLCFTMLYLPEYKGLAFDETARDFLAATDADSLTLQMSWRTVFQVFMFSLSLATGLQPELAPLSPYTLVVANLNALVAQLVFVFLSGAVFARLSQPAQPVRCSRVALVSTSPAQRKRKENAIKVLMTRYVLAGPQPCELVDVKVDLTYKYNTITRTGSYFRATQSLKLVRPEIAFLTHGMLVRHVLDSTSPLYQRTPEMLKKEDAVFVLSVVGLERSSMQSIFHVQHYCVCDDDVIWDAEFEDLFLVNNNKSKRFVDHTRLSMWRSIKG